MSSGKELSDFIRRQRAYRESSELPLKNVRIIDLGTVIAAPFTATLLGDFGAEVVKIENTNSPDAIRAWGVLEGGFQSWWLIVSRNKLPVTLNLRTPEGAEMFAGLVKKSDVLVENFRPGVLARLGFHRERLLELNKGLVIGRISGYGQTGPYASRPGFGTLAEGFSGFTPLGRAQYLEVKTFLQGYLLHSQGDRMLMAHSVEGRFPFLDHRIVEFAARLPDRLRLRVLREKYLLRRAVAPLLPLSGKLR